MQLKVYVKKSALKGHKDSFIPKFSGSHCYYVLKYLNFADELLNYVLWFIKSYMRPDLIGRIYQ